MNNQIVITDDNISILNREFKTDSLVDKMKKNQILHNIHRTISGTKKKILFDSIYTEHLTYKSSKTMKDFYGKLNIFNCHIGQLKLFYTLFEFLLMLKIKDCLENTLIVYIGSAHGFNIYCNNYFFPNVSYLLYDPGRFDKRLFNQPNITIMTGERGLFSL
jgi:hypothetical protein